MCLVAGPLNSYCPYNTEYWLQVAIHHLHSDIIIYVAIILLCNCWQNVVLAMAGVVLQMVFALFLYGG